MIGLSSADGLVFWMQSMVYYAAYKEQTSVVSLCETGKTEGSAVLYSTTGTLHYANYQQAVQYKVFDRIWIK